MTNQLSVKINKFLTWCKKRISIILSVAGITLIVTVIQTIKVFTTPDIDDVLQNLYNQTTSYIERDFKRISIPDSLMKDEEVIQLMSWLDQFDIYEFSLRKLNDNIKSNISHQKFDSQTNHRLTYQDFLSVYAYYNHINKATLQNLIELLKYEQNNTDSSFAVIANTISIQNLVTVYEYTIRADSTYQTHRELHDKINSNSKLSHKDMRIMQRYFYEECSMLDDYLPIYNKMICDFYEIVNLRLKQIVSNQ